MAANDGTTACTSSVPEKTFTLKDLEKAYNLLEAALKPEEDAFNDRFVKPYGFDMNDPATNMVTGNHSLVDCIPPRWRDRIMYVPTLDFAETYLFKGASHQDDLIVNKTW